MNRTPILLLAALLSGCGPLAGIQADLVSQGREGLRRVDLARQRDADAVTRFLAERRSRLDDGFDRDVHARSTLDADWVIASRQAYAIGLDALADARFRHETANRAAADNASAADEALATLEHVLRAQESFWPAPLQPTTRKGE